MPNYEYACESCGHHYEVVHGFNDEPPDTCERCGGPLRKVFHPVGIVFKGPGFYKTDSRAGAKTSAPSSSETPSTPSKSSSDKSESKSSSDKSESKN